MFKNVYKKVGKEFLRKQVAHYATDVFTLDLACGNSPLRQLFPNRVGCDINAAEGVDTIADAHNLPFQDAFFENVLCLEAFEHFHSPEIVVAEIARVLRPSGTVIMTVPFCYPVHEAPNDFTRYTEYGLHKLFEQFFYVEKIKPVFTELQTIAILLQRIAFQKELGQFVSWLFCALSHVLFSLESSRFKLKGQSFQDVSRTRPGFFLSSNYLLLATRK